MTGASAAIATDLVPTLRAGATASDTDAAFPEESLRAIKESGLLGLLVPAEFGGLDGNLQDLSEAAQILASGCLSTAMIWAMHCQQVDSLARFGQPRLRAHLLPQIANDGRYLASVTTEPKGGPMLSGSTPLTVHDEEFSFERSAPVVTGGEYADGFLITFRESPDAPPSRMTLLYADRSQLSAATASHGGWDTLGMRGTHSVRMELAGSVPPDQVIGEPGGFREVAVESLAATGHIAWSACWLGAARSALSDLIGLYRSRDAGARFDTSSDLAAERLARVRIDIDIVGALLARVIERVENRRAAGLTLSDPATQIHLNNLKVVAAEHSFQAVHRLMQAAGLSLGYRRSSPVPLERHFRDLRSASLNYGDDRLLAVTGRLVLLDRHVATP